MTMVSAMKLVCSMFTTFMTISSKQTFSFYVRYTLNEGAGVAQLV
jgi:hypothetical protein